MFSTDFACNTQGMMNIFQLHQRESLENTDMLISEFEKAAAMGKDVSNPDIQNEILNKSSLEFSSLLIEDQQRLTKAVRNLLL